MCLVLYFMLTVTLWAALALISAGTQQACSAGTQQGEPDGVRTSVPSVPVGPARWACLLPQTLSQAGLADLLTTGQLCTGRRKRRNNEWL